MDVDARAIRECTRIQGSDAFPRIVDRGTPRPKVKFSTLPSPLREICGALKSSFGRLLLPTFYRHRFFPFVLPLRVAHQLLNASFVSLRPFLVHFPFDSLSSLSLSLFGRTSRPTISLFTSFGCCLRFSVPTKLRGTRSP